MKIKVKFFASLKELAQTDSMEVELPIDILTMEDLRFYLSGLSPALGLALAPTKNIKVAQDLEMVSMDTSISENAEIAFFPPVTGG
jgi:molybdopterin synthase sulfur carrier subunit